MATDDIKKLEMIVEPADLTPAYIDTFPEHRRHGNMVYLTLGASTKEEIGKVWVKELFKARMTLGLAKQLRDLLDRDIEEYTRELTAPEGYKKN